ncbi:hypothetical protein [Palaeococcus ferrophilus]|uniref:hypothetical protein n=1 Tax=Palaeococcus ferrophilus TaxID=83868 RepID=UPI00064FABE0|nr:hypothetical protein [Palaeococcus ferrophilus]
MKWKVRVAGYKDWHIRPLGGLGVVEGEEVQEVIEVEAEDRFEAAELAEKEFEKKVTFSMR